MKNLIFVLAVSLCIFPLALLSQEPTKEQTPPIAWEEVDAKEFATKLATAAAAGDSWAANPESIIVEYAGPFVTAEGEKVAQSRTLRIVSRGEGAPKIVNVVLVDDGLFDDSIKRSLCRLQLTVDEEGYWKLRKAYRSLVKWPKP